MLVYDPAAGDYTCLVLDRFTLYQHVAPEDAHISGALSAWADIEWTANGTTRRSPRRTTDKETAIRWLGGDFGMRKAKRKEDVPPAPDAWDQVEV